MPFGNRTSDQLPKLQPWTLERIITLLGSIAGIGGILYLCFQIDKTTPATQYQIVILELGTLCVLLLAYIFAVSWKKLHRFAQAVFDIHYINHYIRDKIASLEQGKPVDVEALLKDIADAAANCYSVLTARTCRCTIKEINPADMTVKTVARDNIANMQFRDGVPQLPFIKDNTDFSDLWYGRNGCPRFFVSKNLIALWRSGKYRNSSFATRGDPEIWSLPGITFVKKWTLPYRAALVLPIRFIPPGCAWPLLTDSGYQQTPIHARPYVYGFLCIDSRARNTFDDLFMPELGGAIADAIFAFLYAARQKVAPRSPMGDENQSKIASSALQTPQ